MKSLVVMRVTIKDREKLRAYQEVAPGIISKYSGKILARGGDVKTFEGPAENRRIIIIEFPCAEEAQAFYSSAEYQEAINLRNGAAEFEIISVECVA
ncbi:DUF1330 domain-containing protein [Thalassolituus sp. LLYu03]|uniref:DUF1330 domain-containing protein n=1 Tax=Thalassolituus sp. LLYu03 TaxID=3421656 RepID=UPI003D272CFE